MPRKPSNDSSTSALFAPEELPVPNQDYSSNSLTVVVGDPDPDMKLVLDADDLPNEAVVAQKIFLDMLGGEKPFEITESPREIGFRKSRTLLDTTHLSVLARRICNAVYYIVAKNPSYSQHDIDLGFLKWLIRFSSRNTPLFRSALKECSKVQLIVENVNGYNNEAFVNINVFGSLGFNGNNRVVVQVSDIIRRELNGPQLYSFMSLRSLAKLDSSHATALYEQLSHYAYKGKTEWMTVDDFREWFRDEEGKPYSREWKYIKRDIIDIGVRQINNTAHIEIEPIFKTAGRGNKVTELMFTVKQVHRVEDDPAIRSEIYETLKTEFGLNGSDFRKLSEMCDEVSEEDIFHAMDYTRHAVQIAPPERPIKRINSYFMWAVSNPDKAFIPELAIKQREGHKASSSLVTFDRDPSVVKNSNDAAASKAAQISLAAEEALQYYLGCDDDEKAQLLDRFTKSNGYRLIEKKIKSAGVELDINSAVNSETISPIFTIFLSTTLIHQKKN